MYNFPLILKFFYLSLVLCLVMSTLINDVLIIINYIFYSNLRNCFSKFIPFYYIIILIFLKNFNIKNIIISNSVLH